jgi:lactoylglutathione lyase
MSRPDQSPELKFVVTNTLIVGDVRRSVAFYRDVLGAKVLREGEPTFLELGNIWLTINRGGGPTDDKPEVVASPPRDPNVLSIFLNLRVTDIRRYYDLWSSRGAKFITEPKVHATELRCYMRDPDGYLRSRSNYHDRGPSRLVRVMGLAHEPPAMRSSIIVSRQTSICSFRGHVFPLRRMRMVILRMHNDGAIERAAI